MTDIDLDAIRERKKYLTGWDNAPVEGWAEKAKDLAVRQLSRYVLHLEALVGRIRELEADYEILMAEHKEEQADAEYLEAKLDAATTMLAEAERIVPGVITTAGRFSIGLDDRERAVKAEAERDTLRTELDYLKAFYGDGGERDTLREALEQIAGLDRGEDEPKHYANIARAALAQGAGE